MERLGDVNEFESNIVCNRNIYDVHTDNYTGTGVVFKGNTLHTNDAYWCSSILFGMDIDVSGNC